MSDEVQQLRARVAELEAENRALRNPVKPRWPASAFKMPSDSELVALRSTGQKGTSVPTKPSRPTKTLRSFAPLDTRGRLSLRGRRLDLPPFFIRLLLFLAGICG